MGFSENMTAKPSGFADGVAVEGVRGSQEDSRGLDLSKWKAGLQLTECERTARGAGLE